MADRTTVLSRTTTMITDIATGDVKTESVVTRTSVPKEPDFVKLYLQDILHLRDIPSGLNSILLELLRKMNFENIVVVNAGIKRIISKNLGCAIGTIDKALTRFVKSGIMLREDTGIYLVNPFIFGKGEWKGIEKIRTTIEWTSEGRRIVKATISKSDDEKTETPKNDSEKTDE